MMPGRLPCDGCWSGWARSNSTVMALNVQTALADAREAYNQNADYVEAASASKCKAFMSAARRLLGLMPEETGTRTSNVRMRMELIAAEIRAADEWLAANPSAGGSNSTLTDGSVTRADFRNFRD